MVNHIYIVVSPGRGQLLSYLGLFDRTCLRLVEVLDGDVVDVVLGPESVLLLRGPVLLVVGWIQLGNLVVG